MKLRDAFARLWSSRIAMAGAAMVVMGGLTEACDQIGALDLTQVPLVGAHAPQILATVGVVKIVLRLAVFIIGGLTAKDSA
jgi:uncharacterized membrane protein